jgi:hypothetical protein
MAMFVSITPALAMPAAVPGLAAIGDRTGFPEKRYIWRKSIMIAGSRGGIEP